MTRHHSEQQGDASVPQWMDRGNRTCAATRSTRLPSHDLRANHALLPSHDLRASHALRAIAPPWLTGLGIGILSTIVLSARSVAAVGHLQSDSGFTKASDEPAEFIRTPAVCPVDVDMLSELMLRDLPNYGNRVSQRSRRSTADILPQSHIISASPAEITSLDPSRYRTIPPIEEIHAQGLESIFFTTLERQSLQNETVLLQHYHWAFLTDTTTQGWALAFMYSTLGDFPVTAPPTPPRDSNHGVIAQAIRLWLRDCEAGSVKAPEEQWH